MSLVPRPPHLVPGELLADVPVDVTQRRSIWEFLGQGKPVVLAVLGAPGSGKTTLLSHIARRVAQTPQKSERIFPILLQLRDHARQVVLNPKVTLPWLLRDSMPPLPVSEPSGWWENQLHRGKCVILLDGLDEVASSEERHEITAWISRLIAMYPRNDLVVTSRPHGYRTAEIESAEVLQVRPFTSQQVRRFLHGWYRAVERRATASSGREVELLAEESANDLLDRLARRVRPAPMQEMIIRLPALALAVEADRRRLYDIGEAFRTAADGVTLLRLRADQRTGLERLVLARA